MRVFNKRLGLYLALIITVFIFCFAYTFNSKIDLNGDNCDYYMAATSLASGHGYANISDSSYPAINSFPPGYPLIMTPLRFITDSFVAQKIQNGLFLLLSVLFLFFCMRKQRFSDELSFVVACLILLNMRLLHFATMMMSEMSFLFTSVLVLFFIEKRSTSTPFYKDKWFYLMLLSLVFNYHIRTQGIALVAAVVLAFIIMKQWKTGLATMAGFALGLLPYMLRNRFHGLTQSRYLDTISIANPWRPEEGSLSFGEVLERFWDTLCMLISKALPNSLPPFLAVDYSQNASLFQWIIGLGMIVLIIYGFWQFKNTRIILILYAVCTFGLISLFSTPSENRYLTTILPFLTMGLVIGIYRIFVLIGQKITPNIQLSPFFLLLAGAFAITPIKELHAINKKPFPANYANFFKIGEIIRKQAPQSVKIASRKPSLLYMYSRTAVCGFPYQSDPDIFVSEMLKIGADYVILDQLGYSATMRYLLPAVKKYPNIFIPVGCLENPETYLLKFDKQKAQEIAQK